VTGFVTEALSRQHDRSAFSSGVDTLDLYLKQQAFQDIKRRLAGCFVALDGAGSIAGYYTLAATSVALDSLTPDLIRRLPRYPVIPAVLVGRLAVAADHQRKGLGRALVAEALMRTESFGIGAFALLLDAKDARAAAFYEAIGFGRFPGESRRMFLPLATAAPLFGR
jgi:GNAT superfamily N-acetyltransferase